MRLRILSGSALLLTVLLSSCSKSSSTSTSESGNWIRRSELDGVARVEAVSFVINDTAYVGTGYDGTKRLTDFWSYDAVKNQWRQEADLPGTARSSAVGFAAGAKGYVGTGYDGINKLKDFWEFDPAKGQWTKKADFGGTARYDAVAFGIGANGYITTGFDGNYLKDLWKYDPSLDTWTQGVSLGGSKRSQAVAFVYNDKAYVTTGNNNGATVNDLWEYDPTGDQWNEKRKISNVSDDSYDDNYNIVRNNATAFVMGGKAYVTGGTNGSYLNTTWEYDFVNDVWNQKSDFEGTARDGALGFSINNRGFVATGKNSTLYFDDIFEFRPDETLNLND